MEHTNTNTQKVEVDNQQTEQSQDIGYGVHFTPISRNIIYSQEGHDSISIHGVVGTITTKNRTITIRGKRIKVTSFYVMNEEGKTTEVKFFGGSL